MVGHEDVHCLGPGLLILNFCKAGGRLWRKTRYTSGSQLSAPTLPQWVNVYCIL